MIKAESSMKLPLLITTLLLSASPVVADDFLYLKCDETMLVSTVIDWSDGDQTPLSREIREILVLRIDIRNKKVIYNNTNEEQDVIIQDNEMSTEMIHKTEFENQWTKDTYQTTTMLSPPYTIRGEGKRVLKEPTPGLIKTVTTGDCIKIDPAEFYNFKSQ